MQNDPVNFTDPSGLNMSAGGCSAEFSYEQCGGDSAFWDGATSGGYGFGDGYAWDQIAYGNLPANLREGQDRYLDSINTALYGDSGAMNFDIHYRLYADGSLWANFNIGVTVGGSLSSWQRANDRWTNRIYGALDAISGGAVRWAGEVDRSRGIENGNVNLDGADAQNGASVGTVAGVLIPGPGGKVGAVKSLKPIVIGETMTRVINFAKANGATWYKAWGTNPANWLRNNMQWLRRQMQQGRTIIDIGTDPLRPTRSPYYRAERNLLERNGYPTRRP